MKRVLCVGVACVAASGVCSAQTPTFTVKTYAGATLESLNTKNSGDNFTIPLTANTTAVYVIASGNDVDIGFLSMQPTGTRPTGLVQMAFGNTFRETDTVPTPIGRNWLGFHANGVKTEFYGGIGGDFGVSCGTTTCNDTTTYNLWVNKLVRFDVGGTLWGDIACEDPTDNDVCVIEADTISAQCDIVIGRDPPPSGTPTITNLTRVRTTGLAGSGDLKCNILVKNGDIGQLESAARITGWSEKPTKVPRGKIGRIQAVGEIDQFDTGSSNPIIIANKGIDVIETSQIDGIIDAGNAAVQAVPGGTGYLRRVVTTTGGVTSIGRLKAKGTASANSTEWISIKGDFAGKMIVNGDANSTIVIGGSLLSGAYIEVADHGLKGQVIINANNTSGAWAGDVKVGTTTLTPSYYTDTSASLGGGAVGLVGYHLYEEDSYVPALSGSLPTTSGSTPIVLTPAEFEDGLDLTFYGPIKARDTGVAPLRFLRDYSMNGNPYVADLTCRTIQTIAPTDLTGSRAARTIRVQGDSSNPMPVGRYRLTTDDPSDSWVMYRCDTDPTTPDPDRTFLDCDGVATGVTRKVTGFSVLIKIDVTVSGCPADISDSTGYTTCGTCGTPDSGVDISDLLYFLNGFEDGCVCVDLDDGSGTGTTDGGVDIDDLLFFLYHFEAGC